MKQKDGSVTSYYLDVMDVLGVEISQSKSVFPAHGRPSAGEFAKRQFAEGRLPCSNLFLTLAKTPRDSRGIAEMVENLLGQERQVLSERLTGSGSNQTYDFKDVCPSSHPLHSIPLSSIIGHRPTGLRVVLHTLVAIHIQMYDMTRLGQTPLSLQKSHEYLFLELYSSWLSSLMSSHGYHPTELLSEVEKGLHENFDRKIEEFISEDLSEGAQFAAEVKFQSRLGAWNFLQSMVLLIGRRFDKDSSLRPQEPSVKSSSPLMSTFPQLWGETGPIMVLFKDFQEGYLKKVETIKEWCEGGDPASWKSLSLVEKHSFLSKLRATTVRGIWTSNPNAKTRARRSVNDSLRRNIVERIMTRVRKTMTDNHR